MQSKKTVLQTYHSVARYQIAQSWPTDSVILLKKLARVSDIICLKLFMIYTYWKEQKLDIICIFKFRIIFAGVFVAKENVLTKMICRRSYLNLTACSHPSKTCSLKLGISRHIARSWVVALTLLIFLDLVKLVNLCLSFSYHHVEEVVKKNLSAQKQKSLHQPALWFHLIYSTLSEELPLLKSHATNWCCSSIFSNCMHFSTC